MSVPYVPIAAVLNTLQSQTSTILKLTGLIPISPILRTTLRMVRTSRFALVLTNGRVTDTST